MFVDVAGFHMKFGTSVVIDNLTFAVERGETFGFLGTNGSGKTTTLRALLGMLHPTRGSLLINGVPHSPENSTRVGYLPEERGLYTRESVETVMTYFAELRGLSRRSAQHEISQYLEQVNLAHARKRRIDTLSGGQRQKIQLGVALIGNPELLILDEPTKGLDSLTRELLVDMIEERKQRGTTVILVTHYMEEVERLCERVLFLHKGHAEHYGTPAAIKSHFPGRRIRIRATSTPVPPSPFYTITSKTAGSTEIAPEPGAPDEDILHFLVREGIPVRSFEPRTISLNDIFLTLQRPPERSAA